MRKAMTPVFLMTLASTGSAQQTQTAPATQSAPAATAEQPAAAVALAEQVVAACGGWEAWNRLRYLSFAFAPVRDNQPAPRRFHLWDKTASRARVEWSDREGHRFSAVLDLSSRRGRAIRDGAELAGAELDSALESAYGAWVNDTYWLVMPFKLRDPGVKLSLAGEQELDGRRHQKLALAFDQVGLTPGDRYWLYLDPQTGRPARWGYILEDGQPPETQWEWLDWRELSGVQFSSRKRRIGGNVDILLAGLETPASVPEAAFTDPAFEVHR